ncbi:MAG: hypothetical protein CL569_16520 [Alphaproteobacteria bacterium]|nr:hypothetical protein [Alphaproteobacteria bacterium]|tara:strand:+ start:16557 stop:18272 length:1716 start_codon:yes stop_codon:yes gene_type:complete
MHVVGLNHGEINSSAALVADGRVVAGAPEERFNRQKLTRAFPKQAIEYCLQSAGIAIEDCAAIAQAWNPGTAWRKFNPTISGHRVRREDYFYSLPDNLLGLARGRESQYVRMDLGAGNDLPDVYFVTHHRSHSANAFYLSDFEEAALLTCDWQGEFECTTFGRGMGSAIEVFQTQTMPNSLGMFYGTFTELLGYRPDHDEWRVMALAAFDVNSEPFKSRIRETVRFCENGLIELDQSVYTGAIVDQPKSYSHKLVELVGGREGQAFEEADEWHYSVAKAMQEIAEEIALHFLEYLWERTRCPNLAVGGGFFMNSVLNGKILDLTPFEELYVSYAPGDVGNSIGAALYLMHSILGQPRSAGESLSYIGPAYTDNDIEETLTRRAIPHQQVNDTTRKVSELLADGEIVAVFNGAMEFGERALGNRSILADPRRAEIKDAINSMIKYREPYRPFAPVVLREEVSKYFDVPQGYECLHMEKVVPVREEYRANLAAVSHVDGSGRAQTVTREQNPFLYGIVENFGKITGIPVLLNTSFNINGEPIVMSPDDALNTFFNSGLRHLALGDRLVSKNDL